MYTMLPLDKSEEAVRFMAEKALRFAASTYFKSPESDFKSICFVSKEKDRQSSWVKGISNPKTLWGYDDAMNALHQILQSATYKNCFGLVKQIIGVAIGAEPSGPIANLTLAYAEYQWVDTQMLLYQPHEISQKFNNFKGYARYIDDMGTSNIEIPSITDYYNMPLIETGSTHKTPSVVFLSFVFHKQHFTPIAATINDKQKSFPIQLLRYPGHMSTITDDCKVGCVIAGLTSILRCTNDSSTFSSEIDPFFERLRVRRFTFGIIRNGISKFIARNVKPEFASFVWQTFFSSHLHKWPYHTDIAASNAAKDDALRRNRGDTFTSSWRDRRNISHPAQTTVFDFPANSVNPAQPNMSHSPQRSEQSFYSFSQHSTPQHLHHPTQLQSPYSTQHTTQEHLPPNDLHLL